MPIISKFKWGEITLANGDTFKDLQISFKSAQSWDWLECGTRHSSGITLKAIQPLIDQGCQILILSRGIDNAIFYNENIIKDLRQSGLIIHSENSKIAWKLFNQLIAEQKLVGMLLHSTC